MQYTEYIFLLFKRSVFFKLFPDNKGLASKTIILKVFCLASATLLNCSSLVLSNNGLFTAIQRNTLLVKEFFL